MNPIPILLCLALANLSIPGGGLACLASVFQTLSASGRVCYWLPPAVGLQP